MGSSKEKCLQCGYVKPVYYVTVDKDPVCKECFVEQFNAEVCSECGKKRRVAVIGKNGVICHLCFYGAEPKVFCVRCKRSVQIVVDGLCATCCYQKPKQQRQSRKKPQGEARRAQEAIPQAAPVSLEPFLALVADPVDLPARPPEYSLEAELEVAIEQALADVGITLASLSVNFPAGAIEKAKHEALAWLNEQTQAMDNPKSVSIALAYIGGIITLRIFPWVSTSYRSRVQEEWGKRFQEALRQGFEEEIIFSLNRRIAASIPGPLQKVPVRV